MKHLRVILFYGAITLAGIFLFVSIRWFVLNGNPLFYESAHKKAMSPEDIRAAGMVFDAGKQYYEVEKKKTYLKAGKFPFIEKEVLVTTDLEVLPEGAE